MVRLRYPELDSPAIKKDGTPYARKIERGYVWVVDAKCAQRPCFQIMLDKGTYMQGRGYTSYYKNPKWVCRNNHLFGCPEEVRQELRERRQ